MAYIVSTLQSPGVTTGASFTPSNPGTHVANDLLLYCISQDGGATPVSFWTSSVTASAAADTLTYSGSDYWTDGDQITLSGTTAPGGTTKETVRYFVRDLNTGAKTFKVAATSGGAAIDLTTAGSGVVANLMAPGANHPLTGSGWTMLGNQNDSGQGVRQAWAYKIASGAGSTAPTFYGSNDDWYVTGIVIRDAHATAPFGTTPASGTNWARTDASGNSTTSGSLTSSENGCLLLYSWAYDSNNVQYGFCKLSEVWAVDKRTVGSTLTAVIGAYQQAGDGSGAGAAAPTVTYYNSRTGEGGNGWVLAIRNKSGGSTQPDIRAATTELRWYGALGALHDATTTWQSPSNFAASINSITCSSTAPTVSTTGTALNSNWQTYTDLSSVEVTAGNWSGGTHTISSTDMSGKVFGFEFYRSPGPGSSSTTHGSDGVIVAFSDGTNWVAYQVLTLEKSWISTVTQPGFIALGTATEYASSGSINWSAVTRIGYFWHRTGSSASNGTLGVGRATLFGATALVGGGENRPATFADYQIAMASWSGLGWADLQGSAQVLARSSLQIGDGGTTQTYFDAAASSFEYPPAWSNSFVSPWQMSWNATAGATALTVNAGASDTIKLAAGVCATDVQQALTIDSGSSTSATYEFTGMSFVGWAPTWKTGVDVSGATFKSCDPIAFRGADVTDCTIKTTTAGSTEAAATWDTSGATVTRTTIDVSGTSAGYHIELGSSVTSITLNGVTFTGTPGTDKIHALATTGTVTITVDGTGTAITSADVTSAGATISVVSPSVERGLEFTGLIAGSKVKVFTTGTDTELFSTASSGTTETWDDATSGSITVDYVVMKAGYLPIRVTGVTVTGAVSTGVVSTPISQTADRAYAASSGLAIGGGTPNVFANTSTKRFGLSTTSTLQNFYSYFIEQWIALGDTGETFANKTFPIVANGPNSFTFHEWEFDTTTYANSITNLSRDGLRYVDASDTVLATWSAILTSGVPSGARVRFQQVEGTTQSAAVTSGDMDQLIQVYGDATHGNFDRTGYLKLKVQESGYDQIESDAVTLYGTLEDQLYVVGLAPTANGVAFGNPSLDNPPTITDHAGSPVTWNGKAFSITITDSATGNSGTDIMRWLRWYFEQGGTFEGTDAFNWHDLVQVNGSAFKTVRGAVYGDTGATLKGVCVVQNDGTSAHADFDLFTADDGTTYTPPVSYTVTVGPFITGSRVQLYDTANSVELFNGVVTGTSKVYSDTYTVDRTVRVRISYQSGTSAKAFIEATVGTVTSSNLAISYTANQLNDTTYNTNAIDGSTVTGITFTDAATDLVNVDLSGGSTTWPRIYAAFVAWIYTSSGIADDIAYIEAIDPANYILTSMKVKNTTSPSVALTITGGFARDATTESIEDIIDITGGNIFPLVDHVVSKVVSVSGVNVITGDIADVPTASEVASAVLTAAESTPIRSDVRKVVGSTITGSGTDSDPWGP